MSGVNKIVSEKIGIIINGTINDNENFKNKKEDSILNGNHDSESRKCGAAIVSPRMSKYRRILRHKELHTDKISMMKIKLYH